VALDGSRNGKPTPVFPLVPSTIVPPGLERTFFFRAFNHPIIMRRSLMEPPGFINSSLATRLPHPRVTFV